MAIEGVELSKKEKKGRALAAQISLVVGTALMVAKFYGHRITNSQAILSDAMESIVNVMAAGLALFVVYYSAKPADEDHPYGHGKVEYFSSAFEGGLITFAAVLIAVEAVQTLLAGGRVQDLGWGVAIVAGAGVANLTLGLFLSHMGKRHGSVALRASGKHVISDFWTSVGITVGLGLVIWTGLVWIDAALALIVGLYLAYEGIKLVRESIGGLMDEEDPQVLEQLTKIFQEIEPNGIIQIHHVKVIRSGWYHHIDAHLVMPEFWDVEKVHSCILNFEKTVIKNYKFGGEMNFHVDPCRRVYCRACDLSECPIRKENFEERIPVTLAHLRSTEEPL